MLHDLLDSAKQTILERLASPLLGSFVVSWALWNWKFIVILFSDASVTRTFELVETISFPDTLSVVVRGILLPLATTLVYVFLYPYPARFIYEFTLKRQRETNQTKQRVVDETPLTLEESRRLRSEFLAQERKSQELVDQLNEEIARLNSELENSTKTEGQADLTPAEKMYDKLEPSQIEVLLALETLGGSADQSNLVAASKETKTKTEFDIGELEKRKLITRNFSRTKQDYHVVFTHEGRGALLTSKAVSTNT